MDDDQHPLVRHFHSLSTAVNDLLAHSHLRARAESQAHLLSQELSILKHELTSLRAQPSSSTESSIKVNQLSLALRTLNEKLELTERLLVERTRRLDHASADASAARSAMDSAYDLVTRIRTREQELLVHQTDLQTQLRLEQAKSTLNERVIQDYADLVRKLEGRPQSSTATPPREQQQTALERLGEDFHSSTTHLQLQLSTSQHDLSILQTQLDAQTKINKDLVSQLSQLQVEMDKHQRDDNTASKMVSRYMKFSQQSTNALQTTLTSLQHRHTSTLTSYTSQIHLLQSHLSTLPHPPSSHHLHTQLLKESFCRRQETKFRLHLLSREEKLVEALKRWLRKSEERLVSLSNQDDSEKYFMEMIQDAKIIIDSLDNPIQINIPDSDSGQPPISGSLARFVTVQSSVYDLLERLHYEQGRRMELEELLGRRDEEGVDDDDEGGCTNNDEVEEEEDLVIDEHIPLPSSSYTQNTKHIPTSTPPKTEISSGVVESNDINDNEGGKGEFSGNNNNQPITSISIPSLTEVGNESEEVKLEEGEDSVDHLLKESTELVAERVTDERVSHTLKTEQEPHTRTPTPSRSENESSGIIIGDTVKDEEKAQDLSITQSENDTSNHQRTIDLTSPSLSNPHPLLASLQNSQARYTHIQNGFHDCHVALENLKHYLLDKSSSLHGANNGVAAKKMKKNGIPYDSLRTIVQRLDDYTEDVRVELEIRVLDEEVLRRGYETLLSMHSNCHRASEGGEQWDEEEILAFVNGTDPIIAKAVKSFEAKLRDLEGDVAVVKKVVYSFDDVGSNTDYNHHHNNEEEEEEDNGTDNQEKWIKPTPESLSTETLVASPSAGWISSWISPSRSTTPIPFPQDRSLSSSSTSNLTFGDIMTNRSRKISSPSSSSLTPSPSPSKSKSKQKSNLAILRRTVSSLGLSSSRDDDSDHRGFGGMNEKMTTGDVIRVLQLKTAMPELLVNNRHYGFFSPSGSGGGSEERDDTVRLMPQFSNLGSTITPITTTTRSNSFALGMGMGMGRSMIGGGGGGGGGGRGGRGRGMLGVPVSTNERRGTRRVVSANAAAAAGGGPGTTGNGVLKRIVDVGEKEDVD